MKGLLIRVQHRSMVLVAVYCLMIAHPGPVFQGFDDEKASRDGRLGVDQEGQKEGM